MTKSTKSQQGGLAPSSLQTTGGVHELVARSSAWRVRATKDEVKIGGFALSAISYYHACEHITRESRADSCTHCLHARWIMGGGRGFDTCADGMELYFLLFLLAMLGLYLVGVGAYDDPHGRGEHRSPRKEL